MSDEFRRLLRAFRERRRWSQMRCAEECDLDHSLASRLESGQRTPTRQSIDKLAAGLGLTAEEADRLRLAAGYRAASPVATIADEPGVAGLYALLRDERVPAGARDELRRSVAALVGAVGALLG